MSFPLDPLALSRALIRCPSVTPVDAGALDVLDDALKGLGFATHRRPFGGGGGTAVVGNLYARLGTGSPNLCFAGHTDVVPPGDVAAWTRDPFGAEVADGWLYGRGTVDMKCAIACFAAAVSGFLADRGPGFGGSLSFLITGDEEGPAVNGTIKVLDWLRERGEVLDACLVGEPTCPARLGEMVKIGRRGSLNGVLTVTGVQGHVAYPHNADNPIPRLVRLLAALDAELLDHGSDHFPPSNLEITSVDVGNPATNVIPAAATARFNVRFNDRHTPAALAARLRALLERAAGLDGGWRLETECTGDSFLTPPGRLSAVLSAAIVAESGRTPELSTSGGTSDARFIKDYCPVAEYGMVGATAHKVDERVAVADVWTLARTYRRVLDGWFAAC